MGDIRGEQGQREGRKTGRVTSGRPRGEFEGDIGTGRGRKVWLPGDNRQNTLHYCQVTLKGGSYNVASLK